MTAIVRETVRSDDNSVTHAVSAREDATTTWIRLVYYIFGIIEAILAFRFIFRAMGANPGSAFVALIYSLSAPFVAPFIGIFSSFVSTPGVIEPSTLVAMAVYALLAGGIVKLILILSHEPETAVVES
jgi:uncharacterized protein YggT (Ycf19 family)